MFLQAAGMRASVVHALLEGEDTPPLPRRQRVLIEFAAKLTSSPRAVTSEDTACLRSVLKDEGEVVEATNVVAGFNFANRVADALAVPCEVPGLLRRRRFVHYAAMTLMASAIRLRMNFRNRSLDVADPDDILRETTAALRRADMGSLPHYFEYLKVRPHILAGQAAILKNLMCDSRLPRELILSIGYLVSLLNGDMECARGCAESIGKHAALEDLDRAACGQEFPARMMLRDVLSFARDVTLRAHEIQDAQVQALKARLTEAEILLVVLTVASFNASNRLNIALCARRRSADRIHTAAG